MSSRRSARNRPAKGRGARSGIPPSTMRVRDVLVEAVAALTARPGRAALTTLGTILGVGTLVVVLCLTGTLQNQIGSRFDAFVARTVTVSDARLSSGQAFPFTREAEEKAARLNGVTHVGSRWTVNLETVSITAPLAKKSVTASILGATAGLWDVVEPHIASGRTHDRFHDAHTSDVVVLGASVAAQLGIESVVTLPAISIDNRPYTVVGIIDKVARQPDLLLSVIVPAPTAIARWGTPETKAQATMTIVTDFGAAAQIANEAPRAIAPLDLSAVRSIPPPDPRTLRDAVNTDLTGLFLALALICIFIGAVGIANTTLVAVLERIGEIGLRRSVGARRRHIAAQIISESAILGALGGAIGASIGTISVLIISITQQWTPIIDPTIELTAPLIGMATGILAGLYPSWQATQIEPTEALRR
ncbi:MAG: hypothetical protein B5766_11155 [Candidatus Lumbricidophila eiseniae]|uniref:ABC transporter n=1 Tax=Candidatus Lumbricidiphila eiseniae TaxID=1969409 RepID=A0A2A6FP79_9MICO|nr:MAG: hypothetical protein B5766_11155 [Candidatus Lumbricidophila eiseniae]